MALETDHYIAGGRIYFRLEGDTIEKEIGDITAANLSVETTTAECLSRSNGAAEVVGEAVTRRDYNLTFTTSNVSAENLALYFYGKNSVKTYAEGDTYTNGKTLAEFDAGDSYAAGDLVIQSNAIYEAISAVPAGAFDETEWKRKGSASVRITSTNQISKITGYLRIEGEPLDGKAKTIVIPKVSLSPSGDFALMGDEYSQLVFEGTLQREGTKPPFDVIVAAA
jgi:hypothetical protein